MACRRAELDEEEILRLLHDENEELDDKSSDEIDDNDHVSLEDEEDKVEEDCKDDVDSIYDIDDRNELHDQSDTDNSTMEESTHEDANNYEAKNFRFRWSKIPPQSGRARKENIILRLPGCKGQARNANTPHDAFSLFISENMLNIILYPTNQKIHVQEYLINFDGSRQQLNLMHEATLDQIRAVIGLVIYGGAFESLHENLEFLYKMDGTRRLIFPAVSGKNCIQFLLPMTKFDDKATRAVRCLNDKLAAFRKIWNMFVEICKSMYLVGIAVCIDAQLLLLRGRCAFRQDMPKKPSKYEIKIWMMCDCATKYMINAKVYLGKESN